jgi:ADP-heptose:LPS heptosyltransferase
MKNIKSILIFRALQLGDLLCSVPAFRALRRTFPTAHIAIAGLPWMKMFVERFPDYFDEFIWFPGYPGLPEQELNPKATALFLQQVIDRKFDLALQMQGNGSIVNPMVELFGATYTAGFFKKNDYSPNEEFFLEYPEGISEIHRHLALMKHIGIEPAGDYLEFPVTEKDALDLNDSLLDLNGSPYICVHPGSRGAYRRWPVQYFAKLADDCSAKGYRAVLTGTREELDIVESVAANMQTEPVIAAGRTSLGAVGALLKNASGLISNCTGVSHIASALKTKSVVISMDGEPERWGPLNKELHVMIDWTKTNEFGLVEEAVKSQFASVR